jgi:hypothetical protein
MHHSAEFFASTFLETFRGWSVSKSGTFETSVFFGVVALIAAAVFFGAVILRSKTPRLHHHRSRKKTATTTGDKSQSESGRSRSQNRVRRRNHRPTNPTLSQTGGLPPPRDTNTPPNSQL